MKSARFACALLGVVLLCVACGSSHSKAIVTPTASDAGGFVLKPPVPAPPFSLRDQSGRAFGPQDLRGKWFVVSFLYTHCPDVCPLIANSIGAAQRQLPSLGAIAISVDPKGDTPASVRAFLRTHHLSARFRYVTGTRAQLRPVWARYHVATLPGPTPVVSHSAFELLVDPQGRERVLYAAQVRAADIVHDVHTG
jgi:protein SCO1/2